MYMFVMEKFKSCFLGGTKHSDVDTEGNRYL